MVITRADSYNHHCSQDTELFRSNTDLLWSTFFQFEWSRETLPPVKPLCPLLLTIIWNSLSTYIKSHVTQWYTFCSKHQVRCGKFQRRREVYCIYPYCFAKLPNPGNFQPLFLWQHFCPHPPCLVTLWGLSVHKSFHGWSEQGFLQRGHGWAGRHCFGVCVFLNPHCTEFFCLSNAKTILPMRDAPPNMTQLLQIANHPKLHLPAVSCTQCLLLLSEFILLLPNPVQVLFLTSL